MLNHCLEWDKWVLTIHMVVCLVMHDCTGELSAHYLSLDSHSASGSTWVVATSTEIVVTTLLAFRNNLSFFRLITLTVGRNQMRVKYVINVIAIKYSKD